MNIASKLFREGGDGAHPASRGMKGRAFFISVFFVIVAGAAIFGASSAFGRSAAPHRAVVVTVGEADAHAKDGAGYIGVYMDDLTARMADKSGYPHKTGILIAGVVQEGPAEKAGIRENDIVYLFNGVKVKDTEQFASLVKKQKAGDKVALVIYRDGAEKKISVVLGAREEPAAVTEDFGASSPATRASRWGCPSGRRSSSSKGPPSRGDASGWSSRTSTKISPPISAPRRGRASSFSRSRMKAPRRRPGSRAATFSSA